MKKNIKQFILIVICILLMSVYTYRPVYAAGADFVISNENVEPGEDITISIINKSGIAVTSGQFDFVYDDQRFEIISSTIFGKEAMIFKNDPERMDKFRISAMPLAANDAYEGEIIVSVTFRLKEQADGIANFELNKSRIGYGGINEQVQNLEVNGDSVSVKITKPNQANPEDPNVSIPDVPDPDPPQEPTESTHLEPSDPTNSTDPTESEKTSNTSEDNTEPGQVVQPSHDSTKSTSKATESTSTTKQTSVTTESKKNQNTENTVSQIAENTTKPTTEGVKLPVGSEQTTRKTEPEKTLKISIDQNDNQEKNANIIAAKPDQTTSESITEAISMTTELILLTTETTSSVEKISESSSQTTLEEKNTTSRKETPTSEMTEENSQNTEINTLNLDEQKQAKQEQAFKLTENENGLHNKLLMGGLAVAATGSLGALLFMIIKNHIRPR